MGTMSLCLTLLKGSYLSAKQHTKRLGCQDSLCKQRGDQTCCLASLNVAMTAAAYCMTEHGDQQIRDIDENKTARLENRPGIALQFAQPIARINESCL